MTIERKEGRIENRGEERMKNKEILRVKRNREKERERTREGSGRKTERKSKV
jgi:hypothetical protein